MSPARPVIVAALCVLAAHPASRSAEIRVLFIGNSLTSVNEVPLLVEALSDVTSTPISASAVTRNDFGLEEHLAQGDAARAIERGGWTFVVLQQGPSALPDSQIRLRAAAKRFAMMIRRVGARPAFYAVWPSDARRRDFDGVHASYAAAAKDVDGVLLPVGEAWRAAWRRDPAVVLYGADGFHPTPQASYLAALVITQGLTGRPATALPGRLAGWPAALLPPDRARLLQAAAAEVAGAGSSQNPAGRKAAVY